MFGRTVINVYVMIHMQGLIVINVAREYHVQILTNVIVVFVEPIVVCIMFQTVATTVHVVILRGHAPVILVTQDQYVIRVKRKRIF